MSTIEFKSCIVAYEDNFDLEDIAAEVADSLGARVVKLQNGCLPDENLDEPYQLLIVPHTKLLDNYIKAFEQSVKQQGGRPRTGILTGLNRFDLHDKWRQMAARSRTRGKPWILTSEAINRPVNDLVDVIHPSKLTTECLVELGKRNADFAVIVGHGREDIIYFENTAYCGRRNQGSTASCQPESCSYRQQKTSIEGLSAELLIILSCNAGRLGHGLMPPSCRLALTALGNCRTIIAPRRLYTHSKALTQMLLQNVINGAPADVIKDCANLFQVTHFGEQNVFLLFGDPRIKSFPTVMEQVENFRSKTNISLARIEQIVRLCDTIIDLELCSDDANQISNVIQTYLPALRNPSLSEETRKGITEDSLALESRLIEILALQLCEQVDKSYFWISNKYSLTGGPEYHELCPYCNQIAARQFFSHFRLRHCNRTRLTCCVCGIVEDRPHTKDLHEIVIDIKLRDQSVHLEISVNIPSARLVVGLNGSGALNGLQSANENVDHNRSIHLEHGKNQFEFFLNVLNLQPGMYFFKAIVIASNGISEASAPIQTWKKVYDE